MMYGTVRMEYRIKVTGLQDYRVTALQGCKFIIPEKSNFE